MGLRPTVENAATDPPREKNADQLPVQGRVRVFKELSSVVPTYRQILKNEIYIEEPKYTEATDSMV